jgi:hypothetical protein
VINPPQIPGHGLQTPIPAFVPSGSTGPREADDEEESQDDQLSETIAELSEENENLRDRLAKMEANFSRAEQEKASILERYHDLEARLKARESYKPIPKKPVNIEQVQARQRRQSTAESTQRIRTALVAREGLPGVGMFLAPQVHQSPYNKPSQLGTLQLPAGVEGSQVPMAPNTVSIQLPIGVTASSILPGPQSGSSTSQAGVNPQAGTGNNPLSRSSTSSQVGVNSQVGSSHDPLGVNPLGSGRTCPNCVLTRCHL